MKSEQLKYLSSILAVILVARLGPLLPQVNGQDPSGVLALHGTGQPAAAAGETVYEIKVLPDSPDNTVDIWVSATTSDVPPAGEGPQGWEMGISHDPNLTFVNATVDGLVVVTLRKRDLDGDRVFEDVNDAFLFDLGDSFLNEIQKATTESEYRAGLSDQPDGIAVALGTTFSSREFISLKPNTTDEILRITYGLPSVAAGETREFMLQFQDGLRGILDNFMRVTPPFRNLLVLEAREIDTETKGLRLVITGAMPTDVQRGDCNADGFVSLPDPIFNLDVLFFGKTPSCVDACRTNGDQRNEISDVIYLLNYLFAGGPAPAPTLFADCP